LEFILANILPLCHITQFLVGGKIQISSSFNFHICVQSALAGLQRMEAAQDGMESGYDMQDLEETASVGRGSPVQQELEDSETEQEVPVFHAI